MALNIDTQDLENYPGTSKRVTVDQEQIVPLGFEGDEQFTMKFTTTAYSDNTNRTAIQDLYITNTKIGWCKSSGFAGTNGKFDLSSSAYKMKVKLDATASGIDGNGYYEIELNYNADSTPLRGEVIAQDMESKIRALPNGASWVSADAGHALAYRSCSVEYTGGKFWIISGTVAAYFSGAYRSSVAVAPASTNDCTTVLGFNQSVTSENLASLSIKEAALTSNYTGGTGTLSIGAGTGVSEGHALAITDGTNTEYFTALSGTTDTSITVAVSGTNGFDGISNSYLTSTGSKVQILRMTDPDFTPTSYYTSVDDIVRHGIKVIIQQIDYSS